MHDVSTEETEEGYTKVVDKGMAKETSSGIETQAFFREKQKFPSFSIPPHPKCSTYLHNEKLFPDSSKSEKKFRVITDNQIKISSQESTETTCVNTNIQETSKEDK